MESLYVEDSSIPLKKLLLQVNTDKLAVEVWQYGHANHPLLNTICKFTYFIQKCSFFLLWHGTRSLRMPVLKPASQAGPMHNPRDGTSVYY